MKQRLRIVHPPESVPDDSPRGKFMTADDLERVRQLLVDALGHYECTVTEPDPVARIADGNRLVRRALRRLS